MQVAPWMNNYRFDMLLILEKKYQIMYTTRIC